MDEVKILSSNILCILVDVRSGLGLRVCVAEVTREISDWMQNVSGHEWMAIEGHAVPLCPERAIRGKCFPRYFHEYLDWIGK